MITTIALDLDGTLLDQNGLVSSVNKNALERAVAAGINVLICSGRHHFDISWVAETLPPVSGLISSNGALFADGSGSTISSIAMATVEIEAVADAIKAAGLSGIWYTDKRIILDPDCPVATWYTRRNELVGNILNLSQELDTPSAIQRSSEIVHKVAVSGYTADELSALDREFDARGISCTSSAPHNREIMATGVSKSLSVAVALEHNGAGPANLVAVGDGMNDIDLIQFAGTGIAMENACDELKAAACGICPANTDDGVAVVVNLVLDGRIDEICTTTIAGDAM